MEVAWICLSVVAVFGIGTVCNTGFDKLPQTGQHWSKKASLPIWGEECKIRVRAGHRLHDPAASCFIELNSRHIENWQTKDTFGDYVVAIIKPSCNGHGVFFVDVKSELQFVHQLNYTLSLSSYGGFVVVASLQGNSRIKPQSTEMLKHLLDSLGTPFSAEAYFNDTWMFISKIGFPQDTEKVFVPAGAGPVTMEKTFRIKRSDSCVGPLPPHHWFRQTSAVQSNNAYTHFDDSNNIYQCTGRVHGWQYLAKQPGQVYLDLFSNDPDDEGPAEITTELLSSTLLTVTQITGTPQYMCIPPGKQPPQFDVAKYGYYGFHYDDLSNSKDVLAVAWGLDHQMSLPCQQEQTMYATNRIVQYPVDQGGWADGTEDLKNPRYVQAQVGLRPIFDTSFVLTCACEDNSDCQRYGDHLMQCVDGTCRCHPNATFSHTWKVCVYGDLARQLNVQVHQSSTYQRYGAHLAIESEHATCSSTLYGANQWYLLDMGRPVTLFGLRIRVPKPVRSQLYIWEDAGQQEAGAEPDFIISPYAPARTLPTPKIGAIELYGGFPWRLRGSSMQVLNREGILYTSPKLYSGEDLSEACMKVENITVGMIKHSGNFYDSSGQCFQTSSSVPKAHGEEFCTDVFYWDDGFIRALHTDNKEVQDKGLVVSGKSVDFSSNPTKFQFNLRDGKNSECLYDVLDEAFHLSLSDDPNSCLGWDTTADKPVLSVFMMPDCPLFKFIESEKYEGIWPRSLNIPVTANTGMKEVDIQSYTDPSMPNQEFCATTNSSDQPASAIGGLDLRLGRVNVYAFDNNRELAEDNVTLQLSEGGLQRFAVGVAQMVRFHKGVPVFSQQDITPCLKYRGFADPHHQTYLDCEEIMTGRFIAIYNPDFIEHQNHNIIQLCDIEVLGLLPQVSSRPCSSDSDCLYEAALYCDPIVAVCSCRFGYYYQQDKCVDVDECEEIVCEGDWSYCVNTEGSYECACKEGYIMDPGRKTCSAYNPNDMMLLRISIGLSYVPEYGDIKTVKAQALKQAIENTMKKIITADERLKEVFISNAEVVSMFIPNTTFDLLLGVRKPLTETQQNYLAWLLRQKMLEEGIDLNGAKVPVVSAVNLQYDRDGTEITIPIQNPCDAGWCLHGAVCELYIGVPHCRCAEGFSGPRCSDGPYNPFLFLILMSTLGLIIVCLLIIGACFHCNLPSRVWKKKRFGQKPYSMKGVPGCVWTSRPYGNQYGDQFYYGDGQCRSMVEDFY